MIELSSEKVESGQDAQGRDVLENLIYKLDAQSLHNLLKDHSTGRNIRWATRDYIHTGIKGYGEWDNITVNSIIRSHGYVIQPRVDKTPEEQRRRSVEKAEVFTPSWVCNAQNNLVDAAWFNRKNAGFNKELSAGNPRWKTIKTPIKFTKSKSWQEYVKAPRLEISCGEAPYLTCRYDTVSGLYIQPPDRIGFLDRKLRVVTENTSTEEEWIEWALKAVKATYGFEYQGDSLLIARENLLFAVKEYFEYVFKKPISLEFFRECSVIISWNVWQMDGLKFVVPGTCHSEAEPQRDLFDMPSPIKMCPGCKTGDISKHNGVRCRIMDWDTGNKVLFMPPFDFKNVEDVEKP